jgi:HD-GYP domain-containing protein (c-di-GMP phosphodiesterase class II)
LERTYLQSRFKEIPIVASSHHEKIDGTGYPNKLKGKNIPEMARIMAVADVFDALTYIRHYRRPMPIDKVISSFKKDIGKKFDGECVNALLDLDISDVLEVMTSGTDKHIVMIANNVFNGTTLRRLGKIYNESKNTIVQEFKNYYPVQNVKVEN